MDATRFDGWTRSLVAAHRRHLLGGLLGLAVAAVPDGTRADSNDCRAERKRGDACERTCQCVGDYRCGKPRPPAERLQCGQNLNAKEVCCLGQGDTCGGNDCACCGAGVCVNGRCDNTCAANRCPGCLACIQLADGTSRCGFVSSADCTPCASATDCFGGRECIIYQRWYNGRVDKLGPLCGRPEDTAVCGGITPC